MTDDAMRGIRLSIPVPGAADRGRATRSNPIHRQISELREPVWNDAFALFGLLAPLMMLAVSLSYVDVFIHGSPGGGSWRQEYATAPIWGAYALPAVAVLLGLRRTGALLAFGASAILTTSPLWSDYWWISSGGMHVLIPLGVISGIGLLLSDGPRRARELMGRPALACAFALTLTAFTLPPMMPGGSTPLMTVVSMLPLLACAILLPLFLLSTPHGLRTFALFLIAASPIAVLFSGFSVDNMLGQGVVSVVISPVLTLILLAAVRALVQRSVLKGMPRPE